MIDDTLVILPNCLFEKKHIPKCIDSLIIWEHPHYFKSYKYNVKKLILHRASMKKYYDVMSKYYRCRYVEYKDKFPLKKYQVFDPIDIIKLNCSYKFESPGFLLSNDLMDQYREKTDKFFFNSFYMWSKKQLDILPKLKSMDKMNRKRMPDGVKIPPLASVGADKKYINEAIKYVKKHFPSNPGNYSFMYPVSHQTAKKFLKHFIDKKLSRFGDYQDFIKKDESYMFHSILSSSINIGLLTPMDVIEKVMMHKKKVALNNIEGFVRQLFWREYQRYCYLFCSFKGNYFNNKKKLNKDWYQGTLGIDPVDQCIVRGFDTGYLHHIERLMVVGNFMNLSQIDPKEGYRWFMEFSIDSYEWVMHQNVYDMVFFVTGGKTMRRPYVSSSNYIIKMSNYKKGDWSDTWDEMYDNFIKRNRKRLYKFRYYFKSLPT